MATRVATAGAHVDHPVGVGDHVEVVLDHHHRGAVGDKPLQHAEQHLHIERMQADRRLVKHKESVCLVARELARELEALGLAARERRRGLAERKVAEPQVGEGL